MKLSSLPPEAEILPLSTETSSTSVPVPFTMGFVSSLGTDLGSGEALNLKCADFRRAAKGIDGILGTTFHIVADSGIQD